MTEGLAMAPWRQSQRHELSETVVGARVARCDG